MGQEYNSHKWEIECNKEEVGPVIIRKLPISMHAYTVQNVDFLG